MSATDFSAIQFTPGPEWTAEDEAIYQAAGMSPLNEYFAIEIWDELKPEEKALCFNYRRALLRNATIPAKLIMAMNEIHERHSGFHVGHIPKEPA